MNPGQQNPGADQSSNFFWLIALLFGVGLVIWWVGRQYVVIPFFWVRSFELDLIRWFSIYSGPIAHFLHLSVPSIREIDQLQHFMKVADPSKMDWKNFSMVNVSIGAWTKFPIGIIFLLLAAFLAWRGTGQFQHIYSMKSLRQIGQAVWPEITPVISLDLVKENIDKGPWAMAQLPLDFCRQHELLSVKTVAGKKIWALKQKPAYRLFTLQLGPMWKGLDVLPIHIKALVFIFLARATGQRPAANALLRQIAASAATGKLDFTGVSEQIKTFQNHRIVKWVEKRHAYMATFMATLLEIARSDGVLASAEFLWLKPVDRRLWFVLNSVGRRTSVVEVAGVFAHWKAEKKLGRMLKTPIVKGAVDALEEALQNILLIEEGDEWRTINEG